MEGIEPGGDVVVAWAANCGGGLVLARLTFLFTIFRGVRRTLFTRFIGGVTEAAITPAVTDGGTGIVLAIGTP